jgi:hypothetical protein
MDIIKFKLIREGLGGITIDCKEYFNPNQEFGNYHISDDVERTRKIPLPEELMDQIRKLKYYFLNLTGHWIPAYTKYYDDESKLLLPVGDDPKPAHLHVKDLWNRIIITGAKASSKGFLLTGKIEVVKGKYMGISTPLISQEDDYAFFEDCLGVLHDVAREITDFINSVSIPIEKVKETLVIKEGETKTDEEIKELAVQKVMEMGGVVLMPSDSELPESTEVQQTTVVKSGVIDEGSTQNAEEQSENTNSEENSSSGDDKKPSIKMVDETPENIQEQPLGQAFGKPAASTPLDKGESSNPGDLTGAEYSESRAVETTDIDIKEDDNNDNIENW